MPGIAGGFSMAFNNFTNQFQHDIIFPSIQEKGSIFLWTTKQILITLSVLEKLPARLSSFGLILVIAIYTAAFAFIMLQYGGIDEFIQEYMEYYNGGSLEGLYRNMGIN